MKTCPCCSGKDYADCCGQFIEGLAVPTTPEQLMRSRYSAYTQANVEYIAATMQSPASDHFNLNTARDWALAVQWESLEVMASSTENDRGWVEFTARFTQEGKQQTLHEASVFHRKDGRWYYIDAQKTIKPGRNNPCHCGSGKKYKKCCG